VLLRCLTLQLLLKLLGHQILPCQRLQFAECLSIPPGVSG
jgi:hypothetical protein